MRPIKIEFRKRQRVEIIASRSHICPEKINGPKEISETISRNYIFDISKMLVLLIFQEINCDDRIKN